MSRFPIDVVEFVEARFAPEDFSETFTLLAADALSAPKVMRAALFLADGDVALLRHYAKTCATNPADVLVRAEFVIAATESPLCAPDLTELYRGGGQRSGQQPPSQRHAPRPPARAPRAHAEQEQHHAHLKDQEFRLGSAVYAVAEQQPHAKYVYCHRKEGQSSRLVRLPYVFVMDRLAERIELKSTDVREF